jgi:hypothetical protein
MNVLSTTDVTVHICGLILRLATFKASLNTSPFCVFGHIMRRNRLFSPSVVTDRRLQYLSVWGLQDECAQVFRARAVKQSHSGTYL